MSLVETAIGNLGSKFSTSVFGYYNLWSYLDERLRHRVSSSKTHRVTTCQEFYQKLADGIIKHGDRIILHQFFVSEWVPRAAGAVAKRYATNVEDYDKYPTAFAPTFSNILSREFIPPVGSVRFPLKKENNIILSAVTSGEYNTDMGVVLSVSNGVYSEFLSKQVRLNAVEATLEGYVDVFDSNSNINRLSEFNDLSKQFLSQPYVIRISSPIQTTFKSHSSHPRFTAWMMRRKTYKRPPVLLYRKTDTGIEKIIGDKMQYDFYHWPVLTNTPDELAIVRNMLIQDKEGTNFIAAKDISDEGEAVGLINELKKSKKQYEGDVLFADQITEFDGRAASTAWIPLHTDPRIHSVQVEEVVRHIVEIERLLLLNR